MPDEKRAIIIGINEYKDDDIPSLSGAINDADDIYNHLKKYGKFDIPKKYYLTGKKATSTRIRKILSEVFYHDDKRSDIALFYFSGHGCVDSYQDGYIMPYDMLLDDPYVNGIKMTEIRNVISRSTSKHNTVAITVLDCCHSGIAAKRTRGRSKITREKFHETIGKDLPSGEGMFVLASSGENETSREINKPHKGKTEAEAHAHGVFTYCLLEGLSGGASEGNVVTLAEINEFLDLRMKSFRRQKNKFKAENATGMKFIELSMLPKDYENQITDLFNEVGLYMGNVNPSSRVLAIEPLSKICELQPNNTKVVRIKKQINKFLSIYEHEDKKGWFGRRFTHIMNIIPNAYPLLQGFFDDMPSCDVLLTKNDQEINLLGCYLEMCEGNLEFDSFLNLCSSYNNPNSQGDVSQRSRRK